MKLRISPNTFLSLFLSTLLLLLLIPQTLHAGEWDTDPLAWGIGFIDYEEGKRPEDVYAPLSFPTEADMLVYNEPGGKAIAVVHKAEATIRSELGMPTISFVGKDGGKNIDFKDRREIGYEIGNLIYHEEKEGYIRVLHHTLGENAWIRLADLEAHHFEVITWKAFMMEEGKRTFHPHDGFGMNLRSGPGTENQRLTTVKGDLFAITVLGNKKGLWAEVEVIQYNVHPCEGDDKIINKWTGWLKLLDDKGYPNIWYYTRGC